MTEVLHMDTSFPGKINPPASPTLLPKDQEAPYSVETPYGYRLDLDFLKYVNDIEKGNTIKKVHVQRRPRYGSLPRGYGYTGSWWTSTESLCSNASIDSRHSSYSYCAPGYHTSQRPNFSTARVEKTLLDARRKLEEEKDTRRFSNLGSMHSSVAGSNTSLSSAHSFNRAQGGGGSYTPASSGLSTPVTPTPAHLQYVREQMAMALRKIRDLEEQVKTIPVLQVKISVLQEEKRQLSVQLKSQKFLGHTLGFSRGRPRSELYIDIPEEEVGTGTTKEEGGLSPTTPDGSRQDSGCEIEDTVIVGGARPGGRREVRTIGVGTDCEKKDAYHVGVGVSEEDLGLLPETEALKSKVDQLEAQLIRTMQELQSAQKQAEMALKERHFEPLQPDHAVRATSLGWQEQQGLVGAGLHTLVSFTQQVPQRQQRTVGIQVYTLEQPTVVGVSSLLRVQDCSSSTKPLPATFLEGAPHKGYAEPLGTEESPRELPIAISSKQVREVLRSELSTSVPITSPAIVMETKFNQVGPFYQQLKKEEQHPNTDVLQGHEDTAQLASQTNLRSIMKRKADREPRSSSTKKNLQFIGVNGGYESTSSESSSESSDESDASEYHEATEKLPESPARQPQPANASSSDVPVSESLKSTEMATASAPQHSTAAPSLTGGSDIACQQVVQSPASTTDKSNCAIQTSTNDMVLQETIGQSTESDSTQQQTSQSLTTPSECSFVQSSTNSMVLEQTVNLPKTTENINQLISSGLTPQTVTSLSHDTRSTQSEASQPIPHQQSIQIKISEESTQQDTGSIPPENTDSNQANKQDCRSEVSEHFMTALHTLQKALGEPNAFSQQQARTAYTTVLQEWLRVSCHKSADTAVVRAYMDTIASISPQLLEFVINMADGNGNTALHYTVSHSNFPVVKLLLNTGLCNADKQNKAGYTAIMLTALAAFHTENDLQTVLQLLRAGDVNAKASQAGQTALMLAVSHGRGDMVRALLSCGAQVNLQDDDGSTALMCACEHGHVDIVRQLLSVPGCDATVTDNLLADCITIVVASAMGASFTAEVHAVLHKFLAVVISALGRQYH
ncbi:KN motif and ankyrin repeat domain-containing protein 2 isoform X2 [Trichomycterus rosablanca]|uniref:KN motif and ankyrin repeat domain-containing protein 2 isoform X2 n=1 Tax=Trichomycterus rosablanca TaxID=2290929 RepID=UPI002F359FD4